MTRPVHKALVLIFVAALVFAPGCEEAQAPTEKQSRVIAARNMELEKLLVERDKQIDDLKAQYTARIGLEQKKLADCQKQTESCQEQLKKGMQEKVEGVLTASVDQTAKLLQENAALKAEIAELKAKLNQTPQPEKTE